MSWPDVLPMLKAMPIWLKLAWSISVVGTLWWFVWGKGEIPKNEKDPEKTEAKAPIHAPVSGSNVNQIIAPGALNVQQNAGPIGVQNNAAIGTQNNILPQKETIPGTSFPYSALDDAFPFGYYILSASGEVRTFKARPGVEKWDIPVDGVKFEPDWSKRTVQWTVQNINISAGAKRSSMISGKDTETVALKVGKVVRLGGFITNYRSQSYARHKL